MAQQTKTHIKQKKDFDTSIFSPSVLEKVTTALRLHITLKQQHLTLSFQSIQLFTSTCLCTTISNCSWKEFMHKSPKNSKRVYGKEEMAFILGRKGSQMHLLIFSSFKYYRAKVNDWFREQ